MIRQKKRRDIVTFFELILSARDGYVEGVRSTGAAKNAFAHPVQDAGGRRKTSDIRFKAKDLDRIRNLESILKKHPGQ